MYILRNKVMLFQAVHCQIINLVKDVEQKQSIISV